MFRRSKCIMKGKLVTFNIASLKGPPTAMYSGRMDLVMTA